MRTPSGHVCDGCKRPLFGNTIAGIGCKEYHPECAIRATCGKCGAVKEGCKGSIGTHNQVVGKLSEERKDDKADTTSASAKSTVKRATTIGAVDATRKSSEGKDFCGICGADIVHGSHTTKHRPEGVKG